MAASKLVEITAILEDIRKQFVALSERVERLEQGQASAAPPAPPTGLVREAPKQTPITEEELLAVSAALAAYLGVRVHIRQIRLISSRAWAQEGRVSIQASHRLHT